MYWGYFHLATVLALLAYTRQHTVYFHAAFILLVWYCLRQSIYEYGEIETSGIFAVLTICGGMSVIALQRFGETVFIVLAAICVLGIGYNALHTHDAYWFKTWLGVFYQTGILAVFILCRNSIQKLSTR